MFFLILFLYPLYALALTNWVSQEVCDLVNQYRSENSLPAVTYSPALTFGTQIHYSNLVDHDHNIFNTTCNLHSWYADSEYQIQDCCFPKRTDCMINKARELTPYTGNIVENAHASQASKNSFVVTTPYSMVDSWKNSPPHSYLMRRPDYVTCGATLQSRIEGSHIISIGFLWLGDTPDPTQAPTEAPPATTEAPTQAPPAPTEAPPDPTQAPPAPTQAPTGSVSPSSRSLSTDPTQVPPEPLDTPNDEPERSLPPYDPVPTTTSSASTTTLKVVILPPLSTTTTTATTATTTDPPSSSHTKPPPAKPPIVSQANQISIPIFIFLSSLFL